jgi:hypothetical protein
MNKQKLFCPNCKEQNTLHYKVIEQSTYYDYDFINGSIALNRYPRSVYVDSSSKLFVCSACYEEFILSKVWKFNLNIKEQQET